MKQLRAPSSVQIVNQSDEESKPEATSIRNRSQSNVAAFRKRKGRIVCRRFNVISSTDSTKDSMMNSDEPPKIENSGRPRVNLRGAAVDVN
jgi:hypothetical protein